MWNSDAIIDLGNTLGNTLNSSWDDANVGDIRGNRMFYTNDYMVSDQIP